MHREIVCKAVGNKKNNNGRVKSNNEESSETISKTYLRAKSPILVDEECNEGFHGKCDTTGEEILGSKKMYEDPDDDKIDTKHQSSDTDIAQELLNMSSYTSSVRVKKIEREIFHTHILPYKNIMSIFGCIKNTHFREYF